MSYFNIDYEPLHTLKKELSAATGKSVENLPTPILKKFLNMDEMTDQELSIQSILELKLPKGKNMIRCICTAKIVEIMNGNGWYYICCSKCARTVLPIEGKYYCTACADDATPYTQRYRVVVRVEDETGTTTLTLFNKEAEQLVGVPLQKILVEFEGDQLPTVIPHPVKNILGKMCVFQVKVTAYNMTHRCEEYTVTRVTESSLPPLSIKPANAEENKKKKQKCA